MSKEKSGKCSICEEHFSLLHWHHTVPQAIGGENSLQIPLCSDCHNVLHAHAEAVVAKLRNGKSIKRTFWKTDKSAINAQHWLGILVDAMLYPPQNSADKHFKVTAELSKVDHEALHKLKDDTEGVSTLQDALLYCVSHTLENKGLLNNGYSKEKRQQKSSRVTKRTRNDLW